MSIYVLRSDNLVKIGFSDQLPTRVHAIVQAAMVPVEFVGHMPGGREVEAHFHSLFADRRFAGEWFVESREMRVLFDAILIPKMPEVPSAKRQKRTIIAGVQKELAERVRATAAGRWPAHTKRGRVDELAFDLGWLRSRAKGLYYGDNRMALWAAESKELDAWLDRYEGQALRLVAGARTEG